MPEGSTTPDLVALWHEASDAADRRDFDAAMRFFAPDAVWDVETLGIRLEGATAIRSFLEEWLGSYEYYADESQEGRNLGNGVAFVVSRLNAQPLGSPSRVQERWGFTVTWAAGVITRVMGSTDIDDARAAAERLAQERG